MAGSCFKTFNRVQDRGGIRCSPAGIYLIFRGFIRLRRIERLVPKKDIGYSPNKEVGPDGRF